MVPPYSCTALEVVAMPVLNHRFVVVACVALACLGSTRIAFGQQMPGVIGGVYPTQLIPGQTTVLRRI